MPSNPAAEFHSAWHDWEHSGAIIRRWGICDGCAFSHELIALRLHRGDERSTNIALCWRCLFSLSTSFRHQLDREAAEYLERHAPPMPREGEPGGPQG